MKKLSLYEPYSRLDVHDIFAPDSEFQAQVGRWGLHGLIPIPERDGDFVFFVTYGKQEGDYTFDEGITRDGVLTWQSQPSQTLENPVIQKLIAHDEARNTIYLFLRTKRQGDYTYLGRLKYLSHDGIRQRPVHFQWQLLDWDLERVPLEVLGAAEPTAPQPSKVRERTLTETAPPPRNDSREGSSTAIFQVNKTPDYAARDAANRTLGLDGELCVLAYEQALLQSSGRSDLAARVRHVSQIEGDGAGYDILSWTSEGEEKYIEVKTTRGARTTAFFISSSELEFATNHAAQYYLYRVYEFEPARKAGHFFVLHENLDIACFMTPIQFRVSFR